MGTYPSFKVVYKRMQDEPFKYNLLIRLIYIPMGMKTYGLASFDSPFCAFISAGLVVAIPYGFLWVYVGIVAQDIVDVVSGKSDDFIKLFPLVLGFVFTSCVLFYISKLAEREL